MTTRLTLTAIACVKLNASGLGFKIKSKYIRKIINLEIIFFQSEDKYLITKFNLLRLLLFHLILTILET